LAKNGYLFLQNDSAKELEVHCNNLDLVSGYLFNIYNSYDNIILFVIPNKCYICKEYLPDNYIIKYRPGIDKYSKNIRNVVDMLFIFK
jgi:hypothetical protein